MPRASDGSAVLEDSQEYIRKRKSHGRRKREHQQARRAQALSFRLAGLTYDQIGERLQITGVSAQKLVTTALDRAENQSVDQMRSLENERLDRAQAAIWPRVLRGDDKAVSLYLQISDRRAKLNGMNAPTRIDLSMSVRHEMEEALGNLENMVLGETQEITDGSDDSDAEPREGDVIHAELVDGDQ